MFTGVAALAGVAHVLVLATEDPDGEIVTRETVSPGGIGFLMFILLGIGTFLLWRSMNKQLKRIDFDDKPDIREQAIVIADESPRDTSPRRDANQTPEH